MPPVKNMAFLVLDFSKNILYYFTAEEQCNRVFYSPTLPRAVKTMPVLYAFQITTWASTGSR